MNEISLSTDLNQIELEINYHKNIAGQSIWEIGRRLNHVKENDLAHGEFVNWVEHIGFTRQYANRFMKIAKELPNVNSSLQIGVNKLYLIATLPEEEKLEEITKIEQGRPSTDAELQELKREIKAKDNVIRQTLENSNRFQQSAIELKKENDELKSRKPQVVEKTVEVIPEDYQEIKSNLEFLEKRNDYLEQEQRRLEAERKEVNEKSLKYDRLTEAIKDAEHNLDQTQQRIADYKHLMNLIDKSYEFLLKASALSHFDLSELLRENPFAKKELDRLTTATERFLKELKKNETKNIIEGEIIND